MEFTLNQLSEPLDLSQVESCGRFKLPSVGIPLTDSFVYITTEHLAEDKHSVHTGTCVVDSSTSQVLAAIVSINTAKTRELDSLLSEVVLKIA